MHHLVDELKWTYVIPLCLKPVKGLLRAIGAVAGGGKLLAKVGVSTTAPRHLRLRDRYVGHRVRDIALEAVHVICVMFSTRKI